MDQCYLCVGNDSDLAFSDGYEAMNQIAGAISLPPEPTKKWTELYGAIDWEQEPVTHLRQVDAANISLSELSQPLLTTSVNGLAPRNGKGYYMPGGSCGVLHVDYESGEFWVTDENGQELPETAG